MTFLTEKIYILIFLHSYLVAWASHFDIYCAMSVGWCVTRTASVIHKYFYIINIFWHKYLYDWAKFCELNLIYNYIKNLRMIVLERHKSFKQRLFVFPVQLQFWVKIITFFCYYFIQNISCYCMCLKSTNEFKNIKVKEIKDFKNNNELIKILYNN